MSNYRYSEYKKQEVRQEKITEWWTENTVWEKGRNANALSVFIARQITSQTGMLLDYRW